MKRLTILVIFVLIAELLTPFRAQTQGRPTTAEKFDEFGDINQSDLKARLDNFAVILKQMNDVVGFVIAYRSRRDLPGLSHSLALRMKHYLLDSHEIASNRIALVDGGVADHLVQELWIVPIGTAPTPRSDARIGYFHSPDESWKFWEYGYLPHALHRRFGVGPRFDSDAEYLEAFANEVRNNATNIACVIAYAQYNPRRQLVDWVGDYEPKVDVRLDAQGTARNRLNLEKARLIETYGIPAARIRVIDGGYRKRREVELWIVPAGEPLPLATPNAFPPKRKLQRQ